jgi:SAM-dependent methyltransferase
MSIVRRFQSVVRDHGLRGVVAKLWGSVVDRAFERRYGLETHAIAMLDRLTIHNGNREHATCYEGSRIMPLRGLMAALKKLSPGGTLVDIGCGKGKVLLAAAEACIPNVRGIEFAHELCETARANWHSYQAETRSTCNVEIIEADAAAYEFRPDETLFFLFNPFDAPTLSAVLANLAASIRTNPRRAYLAVAFVSEPYRRAFESHHEFSLDREIVSWACRFSIFSNAPTTP